jgi:phosphate transport system substrate-binding protein
MSSRSSGFSREGIAAKRHKKGRPAKDVAAAIRKFLNWSIVPSEANEGYLDSVQFIALLAQIFAMSEAQIQNIK